MCVIGLASQQHASVSQGRICSDSFNSCHTEIEVADQKFSLAQSQYTDTGPTNSCHTEVEVADQKFSLAQSQYTDTGPTKPGADPITPGVWQGSHWSTNESTWKKIHCESGNRTQVWEWRGVGGGGGWVGGAFPLGLRGGVLSGNCEAETPVEKKESVELRLTC